MLLVFSFSFSLFFFSVFGALLHAAGLVVVLIDGVSVDSLGVLVEAVGLLVEVFSASVYVESDLGDLVGFLVDSVSISVDVVGLFMFPLEFLLLIFAMVL